MQLSCSASAHLLVIALLALLVITPCICQIIEDLNHDGKVDMSDIDIVLEAYGSEPGDVHWNPAADVVIDRQIDILDVVRVATVFGMSVPAASFTESAHTAPAGTLIEFNPSDSYDPDGTIILYEWDWESDGHYDYSTSSPEVVSHSYMEPGTYNVTLRITDNHGLMDTVTQEKVITWIGVIPEVPLGTIVASIAMIVALGVHFVVRKPSKRVESSDRFP